MMLQLPKASVLTLLIVLLAVAINVVIFSLNSDNKVIIHGNVPTDMPKPEQPKPEPDQPKPEPKPTAKYWSYLYKGWSIYKLYDQPHAACRIIRNGEPWIYTSLTLCKIKRSEERRVGKECRL